MQKGKQVKCLSGPDEVAALRDQLEQLQANYTQVLLEKNFLERAMADLNFHHNAHDGILFTNADNKVIYANPYFLTMMGLTKAEILNRPLPDQLWENPAVAEHLFQDIRDNGFVRERELALYDKQGSPIFAVCSAVASRNEQDEFVGAELMFCNITGKRAVQAELSEQKNLLEAILASTPDPLVVLNSDCDLIRTNPAGRELFGLDEVELPISLCTLLAQAGVAEPVIEELETVLQEGRPCRFELTIETRRFTLQGATLQAPQAGWVGVLHDITEREEAIEALGTKKTEFEAIFKAIPDAVVFTDQERRIIRCNPALTTLFGYSPEEVLGHPTRILYATDEDYEAQGRLRYNPRAGEKLKPYEVRYRRKNGEEFLSETVGTVVKDPEGNVLGFLGIIDDITERTQAEAALAEERNLLRTLIDNLPDYIYIKDTESRFINGNLAVAQVMGAATPDELIGQTDFDFYPQQHAAKFYADEQAIVKSGEPLINHEETIIDRRQRQEAWLLTTKVPLRDEQGQIIGLVGIGRDITRRKQVEAELIAYRQRLEALVRERTAELEQALVGTSAARDRINAILHSVGDGLIVTDMAHEVILANPAAETLLQIQLEQIIGQEIGTSPQGGRLQEIIRAAIEQQTCGYELDIELENGSGQRPKVLRARTALVDDQEGQRLGTVTIIQDVTRLREVDRLKTEFLSTAAHELRTPLTSILGFSEILLSRELPQARQKRYTQMIYEQSTHLAKIIEELLDISRLEAGRGLELKLEPVNLVELMEEIAMPFAERSKAHEIQIQWRSDPPLVMADPFRLAQVGRNLLSNAIKYSPDGGTITLQGQVKEGYLELSLQDQGIGMTPEQQQYLFEPFYRADISTTAIGGTGLGLAISKLIISQHGGQIWLESERDLGTTVYFTIPLNQDKVNASE